MYADFGVVVDAEMKKFGCGFSIPTQEYSPHELHDVEQLISIKDEETQGQVRDFDLLLHHIINADLQYCIRAHVKIQLL